jgi:hypothetical protein
MDPAIAAEELGRAHPASFPHRSTNCARPPSRKYAKELARS